MREFSLDFIATGRSGEYGYMVRAMDEEPLYPSEIIETIADGLLYEFISFELEYYSSHRSIEVEILNTQSKSEFGVMVRSDDGYLLGPQEIIDGVVDAILNVYGGVNSTQALLA